MPLSPPPRDDDLLVQLRDRLEVCLRRAEGRCQHFVGRAAKRHRDADIVVALTGAVVKHDQEAEIVFADILEVVKNSLRLFVNGIDDVGILRADMVALTHLNARRQRSIWHYRRLAIAAEGAGFVMHD